MGRICVIGAGPAGSLVGMLLARRGLPVTLVEQHRFPREKVCGECVSALGWAVLERVGVSQRLQAVEMRRGVLHAPSGRSAEIELPGGMWGISRGRLDEVLLQAARESGVKILQPARVEGHGQDARGTNVRVRDLQSNAVETIECDLVVLADGKGVVNGVKPAATNDFGIKAHYELPRARRDAVQLFGVRGCYGGAAPIEGGRFNIAFSVPRERIERAKDVQRVFEEMVKENRGLERVMSGGRRVSEWLAAPLPRFGVRRKWAEGVIPIGNAAAAIEPIGGEGIGLALRSAEMAAEAIGGALADKPPVAQIQRKLARQFQKLWKTRSVLWRAVGMMVSRPMLCELAVDVMNVTNVGQLIVNGAKHGGLSKLHGTNEEVWGK